MPCIQRKHNIDFKYIIQSRKFTSRLVKRKNDKSCGREHTFLGGNKEVIRFNKLLQASLLVGYL